MRQLARLGERLAGGGVRNLEVLSDLTDTYKWLNERGAEAGPYLLRAPDDEDKLFLNTDNPNAPWHFVSAADLCFNAPDSDGYECVRPFLQPYKTLLIAAGASEILRPEIGDQNIAEAPCGDISAWRASMNAMRCDQSLTDAAFLTADEECFSVHRVVLASFSGYFARLFCGDFKESNDAETVIDLEEDSVSVEAALSGCSSSSALMLH